jgi:hypothetical protein
MRIMVEQGLGQLKIPARLPTLPTKPGVVLRKRYERVAVVFQVDRHWLDCLPSIVEEEIT